jgi:hypothetical protein
MPEFETGWALIVRDWTPVDGQEADNVSVLRVYVSKEEALTEADRLRREHTDRDCFHYVEQTQVERV